MCQTANVNRAGARVSIIAGTILAAGTAVVAAATSGNIPMPAIIALEVLWGCWVVGNAGWVMLTAFHILSLPDVCPCDPPQAADASTIRYASVYSTLTFAAIAGYIVALTLIH